MSEIPNPYIAGNPVTGSEMFFGREDVFASIQRDLTGQHRDNVLVLFGQRRTGKTSILHQLGHRLAPRYLCIFVDLHGLTMQSLDGFLWELAQVVARGLRKDYNIDLPPLERQAFLTDARLSFRTTFLDNVWDAIGDRHLLLMLDEAVRLQEKIRDGKLEPEFFQYLRHLMQHFPHLNFLFSLGSGLEEMEKEYAFLFNVALYEKISFLDHQAAVDLITQPVRDVYHVSPAAVECILQVTSGHPYFTQLICHSLFNYASNQKLPSVSSDAVDAILEEVVERGSAVLKHVWEESTSAEKAIIAGMSATLGSPRKTISNSQIHRILARQGIAMPEEDFPKAIKSLLARDVIEQTGKKQRLTFSVDLQRRWVAKHRQLEWVKEELPPEWIIPEAELQRGKRRLRGLLAISGVLILVMVLGYLGYPLMRAQQVQEWVQEITIIPMTVQVVTMPTSTPSITSIPGPSPTSTLSGAEAIFTTTTQTVEAPLSHTPTTVGIVTGVAPSATSGISILAESSPTPAQTLTPRVLELCFRNLVDNVIVREGPDITYAIRGQLPSDSCLNFGLRLIDNLWVRIAQEQRIEGYEEFVFGWVRSDVVNASRLDIEHLDPYVPDDAIDGLYCIVPGTGSRVRECPELSDLSCPSVGTLDWRECLLFDGRIEDSTWLRIDETQDEYSNLKHKWVKADLVVIKEFLDFVDWHGMQPYIELLPIVTPPPAPDS